MNQCRVLASVPKRPSNRQARSLALLTTSGCRQAPNSRSKIRISLNRKTSNGEISRAREKGPVGCYTTHENTSSRGEKRIKSRIQAPRNTGEVEEEMKQEQKSPSSDLL
ncbi:hypothetical protein M440DRAFT_241794 [Trichoderma longibrachiatum ATCC 18648]|uniref:Uncharacterized protein n=1 Tax=Trichoderma longibrachiatum ATCC 18648 TaxID=983965 RepID=A0A2T4CDI1_TRILO|nr:hypothetical protein M440DRAFT_241794 [Trichoderma longibrachiatum ATCC 18648]